jgi:hypothetical protein
VSAIFPADLYVGAGHGVPVARSTQAVATADLAPAPGIRLGLRGYVRDFAGLALVAPRTPDPYATTSVAVGSGSARGLSLEVAASGTRYSLLATYGIQRVRFRDDAIEYAPEHDVRHSVEAGVSVFPFAATLVRLGVSNRFGRRATAVEGPFEWEACNLVDQGCEFAGSPRTRPGDLGAIALPSYFRLDLGVRQHWHLRIGDRDCMVAVFGTITNLTGHRNIWTVTGDPAAEEGGQVGMRPRSPLVVGIDWRF